MTETIASLVGNLNKSLPKVLKKESQTFLTPKTVNIIVSVINITFQYFNLWSYNEQDLVNRKNFRKLQFEHKFSSTGSGNKYSLHLDKLTLSPVGHMPAFIGTDKLSNYPFVVRFDKRMIIVICL